MAFIRTGNRAGGEADLKWGALVNKLITCPEASACGSFIRLTCADCCLVLLPKADSRNREKGRFISCSDILQDPVFPSRSLAAFRLHLVPQLDVSVAASVIVSGSLQRLLLCSDQHLLGSLSLLTGRSARLMEPLTSPLTLNCAG